MGIRKKHSRSEIANKLAQAAALSTEGRLQSEIADKLGISVMTLHRWRKLEEQAGGFVLASRHDQEPGSIDVRAFESELGRRGVGNEELAALQLENSRLRRLVTDLMLEKIQCLEESRALRAPAKRPAV